jgi:hypothetical protein
MVQTVVDREKSSGQEIAATSLESAADKRVSGPWKATEPRENGLRIYVAEAILVALTEGT